MLTESEKVRVDAMCDEAAAEWGAQYDMDRE